METRPPPATAPPPYVRAVTRVYRRPLRPIIIFCSGISMIWALLLGVRFLRERGEDDETSKMKVFDLILAILFFLIAGIEVLGLVAGFTQRIPLAKMYFVLSGVGVLVSFGAELFRLIAHFILKGDLIKACVNDITGDTAVTIGGNLTTVSQSDAQDLCNDDWRRGIWYDVGWLVVTTILALLFTTLAAAYYHQLLDPTFTRTSNPSQQAPSNAFRMGAWHQNPDAPYNHTPNAPYHQDPPSSPYPGGPAPPTGGAAYDQPPEYMGGSGGEGHYKAEKEKERSGDVGRTMESASDSTVTLHPVSLRDDPVEQRLQPGEGRV